MDISTDNRPRRDPPPDRLKRLPPSAKLVYKVLEYRPTYFTQKEIAEESLLPPRTVRYALSRLKEEDIVEEHSYLRDARQNRYALTGA
ncbi:MAG: hypothetical protein MAG715_01069 [Methanonatronarchaeales archaeon]|nr:hypothetical protein [Methanonatronarchaeales archaeon]